MNQSINQSINIFCMAHLAGAAQRVLNSQYTINLKKDHLRVGCDKGFGDLDIVVDRVHVGKI